MKRCVKCIMPETKPGISFNEEGVCNACINEESKKKIDWNKRYQELKDIASEAKKKKPQGYNCIVPVSGGKDSTLLAFTARDLGLTPLLVNIEPPYINERGRKNLTNLLNHGFDIFIFRPNPVVLKKLCKRSFYEEGFTKRCFEFCMYATPENLAINYKVPLVFWNENALFEYGNVGDEGPGGSANRLKTCSALKNQDADFWVRDDITLQDLASYQHPTEEELNKAGVKAIFIGHYIRFDSRKIGKFAIEKGLTVRPKNELVGSGAYRDFEQLDDETSVISHLLKYIKYGYGMATDHACRDIRWCYIFVSSGF